MRIYTTEARPPIIVMGMHRSGTGLITRILMKLGLFMGWIKEGDKEALFYLRKNESIFSMAGATWDNPSPIDYLLRDMQRSEEIFHSMQSYCSSSRKVIFWGPRLFSRKGWWGWKDPRNTFTLPIWLKLYADARIIHMVRNGVDVASSLMRREEHRLKTRAHMWHFSPRCLELTGGFSLWREYVRRGLGHEQALNSNCLRIRYEDLLGSSQQSLERLVGFLGLGAGRDKIQELISLIDVSRGNVFFNDYMLKAFYETVREDHYMRKLGYSDDP